MPKLALCLVIAELGGAGGGPVDPGWGVEAPVDPGFGIPGLPGFGGGHPSHPIAGVRPPHVGNRPPGSGFPPHVGNRPPGSGELPTHPIYRPGKPTPPGTSPGAGMWVIAYVPGKGFQWVSVTPGVPEKPTPTPPTDPAAPDNTLPGVPGEAPAPTPT